MSGPSTPPGLLPRVAVVCIGTELTRGEIHNTNATWLAESLTALGAEVQRIECVADDVEQMQRCLSSVAAACAVVVATGGLGPTTDDLTSATVAAWQGVPLERDAGVVEHLRERLARRGRSLSASNESQADFPRGAVILENPHGTAPGFGVEHGDCRLFFMPGVPREMKPMFERFVAPTVRALAAGAHRQVRLHCFGLPESTINDRLAGLETDFGVRIGYRAHFPEVEVKVARADGSDARAREITRGAADEVTRRLGAAVYGEGSAALPRRVGELLRERQLTMGAAESCTGGLLSSLLTEHPASDFFQGAVVSYANHVKTAVLGVDASTLEEQGAVSAAVARQMAEGARRVLRCDVSVALTGIAGPTGGTSDKPLGLVHYAAASSLGVVDDRVVVSERPRRDVQLYAAWRALFLLREQLLGPWQTLRPRG